MYTPALYVRARILPNIYMYNVFGRVGWVSDGTHLGLAEADVRVLVSEVDDLVVDPLQLLHVLHQARCNLLHVGI